MIATKTMRRESTIDSGDSDSVSSDESRGRGEFMSRASHIFTGLGRGVSFLHAQSNNDDEQLNRLQERFMEAKQSNLFNMRGSSICSGHDSLIDQEDLSLSDGSTFEMPRMPDDDGVSDDNTGGTEKNNQEEDIDRLQLEIQAPCSAIHAQSHQMTRTVSGVTLNSLVSDDSSKKIEKPSQPAERMHVFGMLSFVNKGFPGLGMKRHNSDNSLTKLSRRGVNESSNNIEKNGSNRVTGTWMSSQTVRTDDFGASANETGGKRKSSSWNHVGFLTGSLVQKLEEKEVDEHVINEQDKSRAAAKLMHKHFQTANNPQSFRDLQKRMKEKGAVTGTSVRALLQNNELNSGSFSSFSSDDGERLELDQSAKRKFLVSSCNEPANQESDLTLMRESGSEINFKQQQLQQRLRNDPLFADIDSRPYIRLPSREPTLQFLVNVILCTTDEGKPSLLTIRGDKYLGKSKFIDAVVSNAQEQSQNSFTVLKSERSSNTSMISLFPFREIVSSALRACDEKTNMIGKQSANEDIVVGSLEDSDSTIVQRLRQRKVLDKSDQLMISRILPDVMLESRDLLSLLGGRSPKAITQDTAATLFKLLIPLQPVLLVFDAIDGDGGLDASSLELLEQLILVSLTSCPQMIPILISRQPLYIPEPLVNVQVDTLLSSMTKEDSEEYIRAIFDPDCLDRHMTVDENVLDVIHARANGCPLFLERLVLWAQNKEIIEIDETRNAVAINNFAPRESELADLLPMTLYEEVLSEINNLSHNELESLKLACCMGMMFSSLTYEALYSEGIFDVLRSLMATHRIFYLYHDDLYKWRQSVVFDAVSSIIISDERQEIHERICDSFARSVSTTCDVQRARHYSITHRLSECFDQYMDAGKQSEKLHDYTHAVTCYRQAKMSRRKRSALREKIVCSTSLGWCLQALERYDDAEKELESALEWTMSLSENERHEEYSLLTALAKVKSFRSKYREAIELYERALTLVDKNAHSSKWLAVHISSYGEILLKSGELKRAKELHLEALNYREMAVEDNSGTVLELALSYTQLGCTHFALQDYDASVYYHKKALSVRVVNLEFYSALVSESLNYCADSLQSMGFGRDALPLALHAVKIRKRLFGTSHPAYAHAMSVLASTYFSIGRPLESLDIMKECIDICDKAFPSNHSDLIPKLMLYGKVLRVSGDIVNSLLVYKRALFVHVINFTSNQNQLQLNELNASIKELESSTTSRLDIAPEMQLPAIDSVPNKTNLIICSKFSRSCDEYAFCVASSLKQMGSVNLIAVVTAGQPQDQHVQHARRSLDCLLLSEVPVAFSKAIPSSDEPHGASASPYISCNGVDMITRALNEASDAKSITILCDACPADIAEVMMKHPTLFAEKVKAIIIMGSVKPPRRRSDIGPVETDDTEYNQAMSRVYAGCQQFNVQTISISNDIANGFPFSSTSVDDLIHTNHMISLDIQRREEAHARLLWEDGTRESRKYVFGNEKPKAGQQQSVWPLVKSINIELVLGVLCCIPHYQDAHFRLDKHRVNGIEHKICRFQSAKAGMLKTQSLSDEIVMLVGFAMRTALLNTSC